jgi:adenylyltransferase/sulfurtransferase
VFGVLPGVIGCIQATEVIKLLTGIGEPLSGRLLIYDALTMRFREMALNKREGAAPITELVDYDARCPDVVLAEGVDAKTQAEEGPTFQGVSVKEAKDRLAKGWAPFVLDVRMATEADIVSLPFTDRLCAHREVDSIVSELPRETDILVYCKGGARSKQACAALAKAGFDRIFNLEGGIKAWAEQIDRRMPVY